MLDKITKISKGILDGDSESMENESDEIIEAPSESLTEKGKKMSKEKLTEILNRMPTELTPFRNAIGCLINGDETGAIWKIVKHLGSWILIALAIIIVGFIIKWWIGLLAIPCAIVWLIWKVISTLNAIRKYIMTLPRDVVGMVNDCFDII